MPVHKGAGQTPGRQRPRRPPYARTRARARAMSAMHAITAGANAHTRTRTAQRRRHWATGACGGARAFPRVGSALACGCARMLTLACCAPDAHSRPRRGQRR